MAYKRKGGRNAKSAYKPRSGSSRRRVTAGRRSRASGRSQTLRVVVDVRGGNPASDPVPMTSDGRVLVKKARSRF